MRLKEPADLDWPIPGATETFNLDCSIRVEEKRPQAAFRDRARAELQGQEQSQQWTTDHPALSVRAQKRRIARRFGPSDHECSERRSMLAFQMLSRVTWALFRC